MEVLKKRILAQKVNEEMRKVPAAAAKEGISILKNTLTGYLGTSCYFIDCKLMERLGLSIDNNKLFCITENIQNFTLQIKEYTIVFLSRRNGTSRDPVVYLQLLDALMVLKKYAFWDVECARKCYASEIENLTQDEKKLLVSLVKKYPTALRVSFALVLKSISQPVLYSRLAATINPMVLKKAVTSQID